MATLQPTYHFDMVTIETLYEGHLHCSATHAPSGATLQTDAPRDNQGLGQSFSPTDLVATALATCMLTIMAISAKKHGLPLDGARAKVIKEMSSTPPRRISKLTLEFTLPASIPTDHRPALEAAAKACPVHHSLHPDIQTPITFKWE